MATVTSKAEFGSDVVVEMLGLLGINNVAYNPGSSFRGLHDSFVNFPGAPEMVLCCHEEIAVAVAHGYWRATGKPMAAAIHSMVGLQHASMAIYNAWCERAPVNTARRTAPRDGRRQTGGDKRKCRSEPHASAPSMSPHQRPGT